jgi:hypothetical protein
MILFWICKPHQNEVAMAQVLKQSVDNDLKKKMHVFKGLMHGWVDQFGCHANQFCLVVTIAMPISLYTF